VVEVLLVDVVVAADVVGPELPVVTGSASTAATLELSADPLAQAAAAIANAAATSAVEIRELTCARYPTVPDSERAPDIVSRWPSTSPSRPNSKRSGCACGPS
jgi:hypothetical protein